MNKILKTIILIITCILSLITISKAVDTVYQIELLSDKTEVKEGETFVITVEIDPTNIEGGIGAYIAEIKYDNEIFEITNLEGIGNWETPMINDGKMIATTKDGECITTKQEIAKITFVAKADVVNTTSEITIENFEASNTETILPTESKKVEIGNNQANTNEDEEEKNDDKYNIIEQENSTNSSNNTSNLKLPYAGLQKTIIPISIVIIASIVGIVYYKKHKKNDE